MKNNKDLLTRNKEKAEKIQADGIELYPNNFRVKHSIKDVILYANNLETSKTEDSSKFSIAGRMMSTNRFGKSTFIRIKDRTGILQAYITENKVTKKLYDLLKRLDIGDFLGLVGGLFKTKTGEWTILVDKFQLISKLIRPLPEKFHGLKNPEKRYRQRYIDLIINSKVKNIFLKRSQIIHNLRSFLLKNDYLEVETPMMHPIPGGAEAEPFKTHHNALNMDLFLRIAPELYLKRLVIGGFERVFEINRNFRNEGISTQHNPEFTMIEFYQAYATYEDLMDMTEKMFAEITKTVTGSSNINYKGNNIELGGKWHRISMFDALEKIGGIKKEILEDKLKLINLAVSKGIKLTQTNNLGKIIIKLFDTLVEPLLIQPTFVTGYPIEISPLARKNEINTKITDRFELFIAGFEIANGFSELNNPKEQKERFISQAKNRKNGDIEAHRMDLEYLKALEYAMPPTAGQGIGIDRFVMLLTNSSSIREVILFPHMKPK